MSLRILYVHLSEALGTQKKIVCMQVNYEEKNLPILLALGCYTTELYGKFLGAGDLNNIWLLISMFLGITICQKNNNNKKIIRNVYIAFCCHYRFECFLFQNNSQKKQ